MVITCSCEYSHAFTSYLTTLPVQSRLLVAGPLILVPGTSVQVRSSRFISGLPACGNGWTIETADTLIWKVASPPVNQVRRRRSGKAVAKNKLRKPHD